MLAGFLAVVALGAIPTKASAHALGQSYVFLRVFDDSLVARVEIGMGDLQRALGFDWDPKNVSMSEVQERLATIRAYAEPRFGLSSDGRDLPMHYDSVFIRRVGLADYVVLTYRVNDQSGTIRKVEVRCEVLFEIDKNHRNLLVIEHFWKTGTFNNERNVSLIFSPGEPRQSLDLTGSSVMRGFVEFIRLGVWHIWIGIDHILFLIALILPSVLSRKNGRWEPVTNFRTALVNVVTVVTFFTIAHTITLSLAALDILHIPSRIVESIIAGSIAAAALSNLVPKIHVREWLIAFIFGLFHGFGFASVLGDIALGREHLVLSLLGFNLGVELGQIAVIMAVSPVLFLLRATRSYRWILQLGSSFLIIIGLHWCFERVFDYDTSLLAIVKAPFLWILRLFSRVT